MNKERERRGESEKKGKMKRRKKARLVFVFWKKKEISFLCGKENTEKGKENTNLLFVLHVEVFEKTVPKRYH